ncbi:MAG: hypothetical protein JSS79_05590 [Bacteroidetes bacterium]|nr:hypothetical protein [Bacteroidota bacterium]
MYSEKSVSGKRDQRWQIVITHEIAHQWFGDAVTESDWDDVWLSEGFATYFTLLFTEHSKGKDEFVAGLKASREQISKYLQSNPDAPVVHNQLTDMSKVTSTLTYQKGAWTLHMLRTMIGDTNFQKGVQSYYKKYFNSNATTIDFRNEMEQASGANLQAFFSQWLYQTGMPKIKGHWSWSDKKMELTLTLEQTQAESFSFSLEVGITTEANGLPEIKKVSINSKKSTVTFQLKKKPVAVSLDPQTVLLAQFELSQK